MVMLLTELKNGDWKKYMKDKNWVAEFKRDGNRLITKVTRDKDNKISCEFLNRQLKDYSKKMPQQVLDSFNRFETDDWVQSATFDGELVYVEGTHKDHRTQAQCKDAVPYYMLFDIMELNGEDLRDRGWAERKAEIITIVEIYDLLAPQSNIIGVPHYLEKQEVYDVAKKYGMEGIVLKKIDGKYIDGRSDDCIKVKFKETDDFIVVGYVEASEKSINSKGVEIDNKRHPYFQALCLAQYKDKSMKEMVAKGRCGGGFTDKNLPVVTKLLNKNKTRPVYDLKKKHNFTDKDFGLPKNKVKWLQSNDWFVIEVLMSGRTEYNNPFQPRFLTLRKDKKISECIEK